MQKVTTSKAITFLGAAVHQGQSIKGVQKTPQILRESGLFTSLNKKFNVQINDIGDISIDSIPKQIIQSKPIQHHVKNLHILSPMLQKISTAVYTSVTTHPQSIMLTIGGDHSVGTGTISGLLRKYGNNLKVIWVDAHPDFIDIKNSNYYGYHGIPLAHLCGLSRFENFQWLKQRLPAQNVVLIGIRDIDHDQWKSLKQWKIKCFTMDHIDKFGIGEVMKQSIQYLDPTNNSDNVFHISFDIDAIDPHIANSTGTLFRGGLSYRQSIHIVRRVSHQRRLVGLDLVEINDFIIGGDGKERVKFRGQEEIKGVSHTVGVGVDIVEAMFTNYLEL